MKKQIIPALCAILALCLTLASCGGTIGKKTTASETTAEIIATEAPISVLDPRDPEKTYAVEPALKLLADDKVDIYPQYLNLVSFRGEEATELIKMLDIVNTLSPEQVSTPTAPLQVADELFVIEVQQGDILYMIKPKVLENGDAYVCIVEHDLSKETEQQRMLYEFQFENDRWASLIDKMQALVK